MTAIQESYLLAIDRLGAFVRVSFAEAAFGMAFVALASPFRAVAVAGAVALRAIAAMPLRMATALAPEAISPRTFLCAVAPPSLAMAGISVVVGSWRIAAIGRMPNMVFVGVAIGLGIATFFFILVKVMPGAAALQFIEASQ